MHPKADHIDCYVDNAGVLKAFEHWPQSAHSPVPVFLHVSELMESAELAAIAMERARWLAAELQYALTHTKRLLHHDPERLHDRIDEEVRFIDDILERRKPGR